MLGAQVAVDAALTRGAAQPAGLEPAMADLILRLMNAPGRNLNGVEIARQLLINPVRVSRLVDRAAAQGLVVRLPDPDDRRAQRVTLTDAGEEKATAFAPRMLAVLDEIVFEEFSPEELGELVSLLGRLRRRAEAAAGNTHRVAAAAP